jgi:hypothetical protein
MSSIQDCSTTTARAIDNVTVLVSPTMSWSEVDDDWSCMDVNVPVFSPVLRDYESRFSPHFRRLIITFEFRSVLRVFLVGIYDLF